MYSLDQVIYFLEQRQQTEDWNIRDAAIAYLKGYREVLPEYAQMKLDAVKNDPLTWDELRQMEGKPVWIWLSPRIKNTLGSGRWEIIYKFNPIGGNKNLFEMEMESRSRFTRKYQGDLWQAFRKERG